MPENVVLERGKRAGNILLARTIVSFVLNVPSLLSEADPSNLGASFIFTLIGGLILIALTFILINPLKQDRLKDIRTIYIVLGCLSAVGLYFSYTDGSSPDAAYSLLATAELVLVIISLYTLGKTGKVFCYCAAIVSLFSVFMSFSDTEFAFADFVSSVFSVVYYVFLGLYIESKGTNVEPYTVTEVTQPRITDEQPVYHRNDYDGLIQLKELMESGVITPAEYEAKKKQILGL